MNMSIKIFCVIILNFLGVVLANYEIPVVQISSGLIKGQYIQSNIIKKPYYSFQGIPYAAPPIGNLRFQPPVKPKFRYETLETITDRAKCIQNSGGSEDCLFLNVYTTKLPSSNKNIDLLPVMVYIHGGNFIRGSSNSKMYGPEYLIENDIVLVTINYRLNIFGFLNTLDDSAPGNVGLKDQLAALMWIQTNIERFNGDPKEVTLFGHSAGSCSAQYLLQSGLAKGLFNKVIMQSGSSLNSWCFESNPLDVITKLKSILKADGKTNTEFIDMLKNMTSLELYNISTSEQLLDDKYSLINNRFKPSLERHSPKSLITENVYSLLSNNSKITDATLMMGYATNEALIFLNGIQKGKIKLEEYEANPNWYTSISLNINNDSDTHRFVWDQIKKHYFHNTSVTNISAFLTFQSDDVFIRGIRKSAELLSQHQDIYFYVFDYEHNNHSEYEGVGHAAELKYLFNTGVNETDEDKLIRKKMTKLWTNFAKSGNPTSIEDSYVNNIKWPKVSKYENNKLVYLHITKQLKIAENPLQESYEFWESLFEKYGKSSFSTY